MKWEKMLREVKKVQEKHHLLCIFMRSNTFFLLFAEQLKHLYNIIFYSKRKWKYIAVRTNLTLTKDKFDRNLHSLNETNNSFILFHFSNILIISIISEVLNYEMNTFLIVFFPKQSFSEYWTSFAARISMSP